MAYDMTNTPTRKIGRNKGKPRLWLEGKILLDAGFTHGARYNIVHFPNGFDLVLNPDGKRKVSGKTERPVIDISATGLGAIAHGVEVVTVSTYRGHDAPSLEVRAQ